jgi:head-tail adaptor
MLQPKSPQIGTFDKQLTIQQKVVGSNDSNEDEETGWENIATNPIVKGSIEDRLSGFGSGGEVFRGNELTAYQGVTINMRYRTDVTPTNRIVCEGFIYDILAVAQIGRKRFLQITAETGRQYQE